MNAIYSLPIPKSTLLFQLSPFISPNDRQPMVVHQSKIWTSIISLLAVNFLPKLMKTDFSHCLNLTLSNLSSESFGTFYMEFMVAWYILRHLKVKPTFGIFFPFMFLHKPHTSLQNWHFSLPNSKTNKCSNFFKRLLSAKWWLPVANNTASATNSSPWSVITFMPLSVLINWVYRKLGLVLSKRLNTTYKGNLKIG